MGEEGWRAERQERRAGEQRDVVGGGEVESRETGEVMGGGE